MSGRQLIIGVDVGGTNTDSVLLDPKSKQVLAWNKTVTTLEDVSLGIRGAIERLFVDIDNDNVGSDLKSQVSAIIVGTTHFINAVIERDQAKLSKVAVLRLCSRYSQDVSPFSDFPPSLKHVIDGGYHAYLQGGFHIDGQAIQTLDKQELLRHCEQIKALKIPSVVIIGIFSNLDSSQEIAAADIVKQALPGVDVIMSHTVASIGFLERENASILNASIMKFAKRTLKSFEKAAKDMGFECPVLLTQNDGTVLSITEALQVPIKTFSSGPTNSMRGAAFLCSEYAELELHSKSALVVDIGGTTADVGELLPNGFPRITSTYSVVGGVRMNFSMPRVESVGLGGGSIVRQLHDGGVITVGPDSVGANVVKEALVFGGSTVTASDIVTRHKMLHSNSENGSDTIGDANLVVNLQPQLVAKACDEIRKLLEGLIDRMKTSPEPLPVILVGGGSFIAPDELSCASKVIRVPYHNVANAIGAAIGKISTTINEVKTIESEEMREIILEKSKQKAVDLSVTKGCLRETVTIADMSVDKVSYTENSYSIYIKAVGDVDYDRLKVAYEGFETQEGIGPDESVSTANTTTPSSTTKLKELDVSPLFTVDLSAYKPHVTSKREWVISEVDADFIAIGSYILGCGGGGHPYPEYLALRNKIRAGNLIKVIDPDDLSGHLHGEGSIINVGYAGSPTVGSEQMAGNELEVAYKLLLANQGKPATAVMALEIGGGNGLQGLATASQDSLDIPCVDADLMGRAYPHGWQIVPYVYGDKSAVVPSAFSDGNGNDILISATESVKRVEQFTRIILSQVGHSVGVASNAMTSAQVAKMCVKRSISLAWWLGRAVRVCQQTSRILELPSAIIDACGGTETAKVVFQGKIVDCQSHLYKGHIYGQVYISNDQTSEKITISFKNENIVAEKLLSDGKRQTICCVPDLISVIDSETGEAVGTPEYRYGLSVFVLAIAPNNQWTSSERALEIGGVKAFGFDHIDYTPVGVYKEPVSVIEKYAN